MKDGELFVTDGGHYIVDLHLNRIEDPRRLAETLSNMPGVVEHGLFMDLVTEVFVTPSGWPERLAEHWPRARKVWTRAITP